MILTWFHAISDHPGYILSLITCWRIDLNFYWVLGLTILMANSHSNWDVWHCQFPELDQKILFLLTKLLLDSVLQNNFISLRILHQSCSPGCIDEFGFWIAWFWYQKLKIFPFEYLNVKVENSAARRILTWVCRFYSRDLIARFLKFEDQLWANVKDIFLDRDWIKKMLK